MLVLPDVGSMSVLPNCDLMLLYRILYIFTGLMQNTMHQQSNSTPFWNVLQMHISIQRRQCGGKLCAEPLYFLAVFVFSLLTVGGGAHREMAGTSSTTQSTPGGTLQFHHGSRCVSSRVSAHPFHPEQPGRVSTSLQPDAMAIPHYIAQLCASYDDQMHWL